MGKNEAGGTWKGSCKPACVMYQITIKSVLKRLHPIKGFVYHSVSWDPFVDEVLRVEVRERKGSRGRCSGCGRQGPGYDRQAERQWRFVPLWGLVVWLVYAARRIDCPSCGPTIERLPWASGKLRICEVFGTEFCKGIRFICSDMWKPYLKVAAVHLPGALQILDPFHIVKKLNDAVDEIRREAATDAKQRPGFQTRARVQAGLEPLLKKMR